MTSRSSMASMGAMPVVATCWLASPFPLFVVMLGYLKVMRAGFVPSETQPQAFIERHTES